MNAVTFTIKLLEPLLATGLEGDPNAGVSINYIAGSVLRGTIIGFYLKKNNLTELALTNNERRIFFDGSVCYLNAYPQIYGQRSFPTPFAWQKKKDDDLEKFENLAMKKRTAKTSYKNLKFPFFIFETGNDVVPVSPKFRLAIHTQRDAVKGRSTSDEGAVFRYESIAEGTKFNGAIISEDKKLLEKIKELIEEYNKAVFGGSRSAGYGKAEFGEINLVEDWKEFEPLENDNNEISIYILSNVLLRGENGNYKSELTSEDFGLENVTLCENKTFMQTEMVGGFNQKWGLPLPQALSIKAGSVFTFSANQNISTNKLDELTAKGIGERLSEGFGRITYNLTTFDILNEITPTTTPNSDSSISNTDLRDRILERVLQQKLDSQLVIKIDGYDVKGSLSNSQIARLRSYIRGLLRNENYDLAKLGEFYEELKGNSRTQFKGARIGGKSFIDWTKENHFETSWTLKLGGETRTSDDLHNKYNLLLIDGVLAKKAKERE